MVASVLNSRACEMVASQEQGEQSQRKAVSTWTFWTLRSLFLQKPSWCVEERERQQSYILIRPDYLVSLGRMLMFLNLQRYRVRGGLSFILLSSSTLVKLQQDFQQWQNAKMSVMFSVPALSTLVQKWYNPTMAVLQRNSLADRTSHLPV